MAARRRMACARSTLRVPRRPRPSSTRRCCRPMAAAVPAGRWRLRRSVSKPVPPRWRTRRGPFPTRWRVRRSRAAPPTWLVSAQSSRIDGRSRTESKRRWNSVGHRKCLREMGAVGGRPLRTNARSSVTRPWSARRHAFLRNRSAIRILSVAPRCCRPQPCAGFLRPVARAWALAVAAKCSSVSMLLAATTSAPSFLNARMRARRRTVQSTARSDWAMAAPPTRSLSNVRGNVSRSVPGRS